MNQVPAQLDFGWLADDAGTNSTPVVPVAADIQTAGQTARPKALPRRYPMGQPATAKPMEELRPAPAVSNARRGRPEHVSDLLLVVLEKYGIDPEEFLANLES